MALSGEGVRQRLIEVRGTVFWPRDVAVTKPPACPPGWHVAPPDFVGIGVQKAGTSWWHRLITSHPDVYTVKSLPKELHFFDNAWIGNEADFHLERYEHFFPRPPGGKAGENTPRYMVDFWVAPLLASVAPNTKIMAILRDPVERFHSAAGHELTHGAKMRPIVAAQAMARGFYHQQLRGFLRHFPREQVLVLQYEQLRADPRGELDRTLQFLGLSPLTGQVDFNEQVNPSRGERPHLPDVLREELVARYQDDVARLAADFPEIDVAKWRNFRHLAVSS
ncbi:MAG: sulfotransferase domain-containing protein [Actinomycetota bacterium]|nr:sulfotransferase domain-containing protein [Actinomycetota bacterium]